MYFLCLAWVNSLKMGLSLGIMFVPLSKNILSLDIDEWFLVVHVLS
ncbi:hypothetical protein J2S05_003949 [Alkalicoccobacillus murimartini]|uniref:Uncharacterized protein n=1 Tax=Alkalicoccobacillus murimartini TaxID=171685 RepID=A0ABT9YQ01_9BACI|nr:hypothetical protein [Alkalicoccobacillus murimartini]